MIQTFFPDEEYTSTYDIDFQTYYEKGYRGVIFDIDNTLVPHNAGPTKDAIDLMKHLKEIGFSVCLLSNNKEPRVASFNEPLQVNYIYKANKPCRLGYIDAMRLMGTRFGTTMFVGDQLFTDIWGANRAGLFSILVHPIHPKEEIQIVLKRFLEKPILWAYHRGRKNED